MLQSRNQLETNHEQQERGLDKGQLWALEWLFILLQRHQCLYDDSSAVSSWLLTSAGTVEDEDDDDLLNSEWATINVQFFRLKEVSANVNSFRRPDMADEMRITKADIRQTDVTHITEFRKLGAFSGTRDTKLKLEAIDSDNRPYVEFIFYYRSKSALQRMGILKDATGNVRRTLNRIQV